MERGRPDEVESERFKDFFLKIHQIFRGHVPFLPSIDHIDHVYEGGDERFIQFGGHEETDD